MQTTRETDRTLPYGLKGTDGVVGTSRRRGGVGRPRWNAASLPIQARKYFWIMAFRVLVLKPSEIVTLDQGLAASNTNAGESSANIMFGTRSSLSRGTYFGRVSKQEYRTFVLAACWAYAI